MKKILFATEFSAHASQIFLYALDLAKKNKASILVLHAYHVPVNPKLSMADMGNQSMNKLQDFIENNTPVDYQEVEVHFMAEMGFPADAIISIAQDEEIDCIIMGMKGKTNAIEAYFGSVALDVTSRTDLPVILIPSTNRFKPLQNIAYGFDLKLADLICLDKIHQLVGKGKTTINYVHFIENGEDIDYANRVISFLKSVLREHMKFANVSFSISHGKFETKILDYLIQNEVDLFITQSRTRNWKFRFVEPSSSNRIARKIDIPMLILK